MENFIFCAVSFIDEVKLKLMSLCQTWMYDLSTSCCCPNVETSVFWTLSYNFFLWWTFSRADASKMKRFVIIVNGYHKVLHLGCCPLTIITKRSILNVATVLDPPLKYHLHSSLDWIVCPELINLVFKMRLGPDLVIYFIVDFISKVYLR